MQDKYEIILSFSCLSYEITFSSHLHILPVLLYKSSHLSFPSVYASSSSLRTHPARPRHRLPPTFQCSHRLLQTIVFKSSLTALTPGAAINTELRRTWAHVAAVIKSSGKDETSADKFIHCSLDDLFLPFWKNCARICSGLSLSRSFHQGK